MASIPTAYMCRKEYLTCSCRADFATFSAMIDDDGDAFLVRDLVHRFPGKSSFDRFFDPPRLPVSIRAKTRSHLGVPALYR
jgi:hypothetical protein